MRLHKKFRHILTILVILFAVIGCNDSNDVVETTPRTGDEVRADFSKLTFEQGNNDLTLESIVPGYFWDFRMVVPDGASIDNKLPLIVRLHGGATTISSTAHTNTDCLVGPGFVNMPAYILSPNSKGLFWYDDINIIQILALVELTIENLHVDPSKVVVMGYSDGGNGAFFFSQYYPDLFSAAIPMASSYSTTNQNGDVHQFENPLYVIHGTEDQLFPINITKGYVSDAINAGSDITFVEAEGLEHYNPCDYVSYLQEAAEWLENTVWD